MTIGKGFLTRIGLLSVLSLRLSLRLSICLSICLSLSACSHEWDALDPAFSGSSVSAGSAGSASIASSGAGGAGTSGAGAGGAGEGGAINNECAPLLPPVARCGDVIGTFEDPVQFDADWYLAAGAGSIEAVGGVAALTMAGSDDTVFAATHADFTLKDCGVWVEIVEVSDQTDAMVRLSLSNPFAQSRYSVGVLSKSLEVHIDGASVVSTPYDGTQMRYVRVREDGGDLYFGHSSDGRCWTEIHNAPNMLMGDVEGRIAVKRVPTGTGSPATGKFDNYCVDSP